MVLKVVTVNFAVAYILCVSVFFCSISSRPYRGWYDVRDQIAMEGSVGDKGKMIAMYDFLIPKRFVCMYIISLHADNILPTVTEITHRRVNAEHIMTTNNRVNYMSDAQQLSRRRIQKTRQPTLLESFFGQLFRGIGAYMYPLKAVPSNIPQSRVGSSSNYQNGVRYTAGLASGELMVSVTRVLVDVLKEPMVSLISSIDIGTLATGVMSGVFNGIV